MKRKVITALIAALAISSMTACGDAKQVSKSVTVELGKEDSVKATDVLDISKEQAKDAKVDVKKVDFLKEGTYDASVTYKDKDYSFKVKIKDTKAPEAVAKDGIQAEAGTTVKASDCLDKITEASGVVDVKFETEPDAAQASTEASGSTENTESTEQTAKAGNVSFGSDDEITYTDKGDYNNKIIVSDKAGNESSVEVKISVLGKPSINGVADKTVTVGDSVDYMAGVTAVGDRGEDLTSAVQVDSSAVNTGAAGTYPVTYSVTEPNGYSNSAACNVTVNEPAKQPEQTADNSGSDSNSGSSKNNNNSSNSSGSSKKPSGGSGSSKKPSGGNSGNGSGGSSNGGGSASGSSGSGSGSTPASNPENGDNTVSEPTNNNVQYGVITWTDKGGGCYKVYAHNWGEAQSYADAFVKSKLGSSYSGSFQSGGSSNGVYSAGGLIARIDNDSANAIYEMRPNVAKVVSGSIFNESTWEWEDAKDISW